MQGGRKETGRQARRQAAGRRDEGAMKDEGDLGGTVRAIAGRGRQGGDGSVVRVPVRITVPYVREQQLSLWKVQYEYRYGLSPDGAADDE